MKVWKPWLYLWHLARFRFWLYLSTFIIRIIVITVYTQVIGLIIKTLFDKLAINGYTAWELWVLIALIVILPMGRAVLISTGTFIAITYQFMIGTLLRKNIFEQILDNPNVYTILGSPGKVITHFRDDVDQISNFMDQLSLTFAYVLFGLVAIIVMFRINVTVTIIAFLPMTGVVFISKLRMNSIVKYRKISRKATEGVTNFIGDAFGAILAIKVTGAEGHIIDQFRRINENRRKADLKEQLVISSLQAIFLNSVDLSTGMILFAVVPLMQNGKFTIGDFSLFVYYIGFVGVLTSRVGMLIAQYRQTEVSFERMIALLQNTPSETLVQRGPIWLHGPFPRLPSVSRKDEHHLDKLDIVGLTYHYPGANKGIEEITFSVKSGSFTVITGRIGAGKTTFLRVLLGLLPKEAGEIYWNGAQVANPATFFVPPYSAYASQGDASELRTRSV